MHEDRESKRSFLKSILAGSAVAIAATATGKKAQATNSRKQRNHDEVLYHESQSFKDYYKTLR